MGDVAEVRVFLVVFRHVGQGRTRSRRVRARQSAKDARKRQDTIVGSVLERDVPREETPLGSDSVAWRTRMKHFGISEYTSTITWRGAWHDKYSRRVVG